MLGGKELQSWSISLYKGEKLGGPYEGKERPTKRLEGGGGGGEVVQQKTEGGKNQAKWG